MRFCFYCAIIALSFIALLHPAAAQTYQESGGILVMEMENTPSPYGGWEKRTSPALNGYSGSGYLQAMSNSYISGPAVSPLEFNFKITTPGLYMLQLRASKETVDGRTDVANDCFVKVEGDFGAGPNAGNSHRDDATLSLLQSNTKLYGGGTDQFKWTGKNNSLDPGGHDNKRNARYQFKAGKTYKLTIHERSGRFRIDRILFRKTDIKDSVAYEAPESDSQPFYYSGELRKWHKVSLTFEGPTKNETSSDNPFMNYRLNVTFKQGNKTYKVPGYFAADGKASDTGASSGNKWRVHFAPPETGVWTWTASFRKGTNIAVNTNDNAGTATHFNGMTGTLEIQDTDKTGRDIRGRGELDYVGGHYPQFRETGEYFLKQGPDAPENFLAYKDFDGPFKTDGQKDNLVKDWAPHVNDWKSGDPTWQGDKGKGIIGAINYLAKEEMNVFSFLTMNIKGDDRNVFPYTKYSERLRMDCSRLDQWEIVLSHATKKGFFLHFKTQETENDQLLDGGALGNQRKLYYRELIARFSHHLALNWNLGEETTNTTAEHKAYCDYFKLLDPYDHPIVLHTYPNEQDKRYDPLLGYSNFDGLSIQTSKTDFSKVHNDVARWVKKSAQNGRKWLVACDEPGDAQWAIRQDNDKADSYEDGRKNALWGTHMAGGWGNEWYFGYQNDHSDLTLQDFRTRDQWWRYCRIALDFWTGHDIPYWEMVNDNDKSDASNDYCFYKNGEVYVVYLKNGGTTQLDLRNISGDFEVKWYNPRGGGALADGSVKTITGGAWRSLGEAPKQKTRDWTILIKRTSGSQPPVLAVTRFNLMAGSALVRELKDGDEIFLSDFDQSKTYHIEAIVEGTVESVIFDLNSTGKTENTPPYDFSPFMPALGGYALSATPYSADSGGGVSGDAKAINFTIIEKPVLEVTQFVLVNADTDQDIQVIQEGDVINLVDTGDQLNIRAEVNGPVESVIMNMNGTSVTESVAPYAYAGDSNGDYDAWTATAGDYTMVGTPYDADGGSGNVGDALTVNFKLIVDAGPTDPKMMSGEVVASTAWQTVNLPVTYDDMVVTASLVNDIPRKPMVTRIRNASGKKFEIKVQRLDSNAGITDVKIYWFAMEAGAFTADQAGVKIEAQKVTSTVTDRKDSWTGQSVSYLQGYSNPVVLGQVMSFNDPVPSIFWNRGDNLTSPATASSLVVGKHVGEDPNDRKDETLGVIVLEAGTGILKMHGDDLPFEAALGADIVEGVTTDATYDLSITAHRALVNQSGMDGGDGGLAILKESLSPANDELTLAIDEDQWGDDERDHTTEQVGYLALGMPAISSSAKIVTGEIQASTNWKTVTLPLSYTKKVVTASIVNPEGNPPLITRVRNRSANQFDVRVQRFDGKTGEVTGIKLFWMAMEAGTYTKADTGLKMEAHLIMSRVTDYWGSWKGEPLAYQQPYQKPVILGQVSSQYDERPSVFWSRGFSQIAPASATSLFVGKHVGAGPDTDRKNEILGVIIMETDSGTLKTENGDLLFESKRGGDTIEGVDTNNAYTLDIVATQAFVNQTAQDGMDGGWAIMKKDPSRSLTLAIDEEQVSDEERLHTTEMVGYLAVGTPEAQVGGNLVAGINMNGPSTVIEGQAWMSMNEARLKGLKLGAGTAKETTSIVPIDGGDATEMLQSYIIRENNNLYMSYPVENGDFEIYVYCMSHKSTQRVRFDVLLEGAVVATDQGFLSSDDRGTWRKFGPFETTVANGVLNMTLGSIIHDNQDSDPQLMGLVIQKR